MTKLKKCKQHQKSLKVRENPKIFKNIHLFYIWGIQNTNVPKWKKRYEVCTTIMEGKYYTFKTPKMTFIEIRNLSCNSENIVYVIKCSKCKEIYKRPTKALNTRIFLHKSNIKLPENRKVYVSKHLYECSSRMFKIMPIYQTDDYSLTPNKRKKNS